MTDNAVQSTNIDPQSVTKERLVLLAVVTTFLSLIPTAYAALISNSTTLTADLLRCSAEFFAILLSWIILKKVSSSDDQHYNYGFGKLEHLACIAVGAALFVTFLVSFFAGMQRLIAPEHLKNTDFGLLFAMLSVIGNVTMWVSNYLTNRKSPSLVTDSQCRLFRAKTFATIIVVVSIGASTLFPLYSWSIYLDGLGSLGLSFFMLWSAYALVSASVPDLIDCALEEAMQLSIAELLKQNYSERFVALKRIRSRRAGKRIFVELSISFDPDLALREFCATSLAITKTLKEHLPTAEIVLVPIDADATL